MSKRSSKKSVKSSSIPKQSGVKKVKATPHLTLPKYPLYETFSKSSSKTPDVTEDADLTPKEKTLLLDAISRSSSAETKTAIIMLIMEHSKTENFEINLEDFKLPYGIQQKGKDVYIDLEKLPIPLKRILWKFINIKTG